MNKKQRVPTFKNIVEGLFFLFAYIYLFTGCKGDINNYKIGEKQSSSQNYNLPPIEKENMNDEERRQALLSNYLEPDLRSVNFDCIRITNDVDWCLAIRFLADPYIDITNIEKTKNIREYLFPKNEYGSLSLHGGAVWYKKSFTQNFNFVSEAVRVDTKDWKEIEKIIMEHNFFNWPLRGVSSSTSGYVSIEAKIKGKYHYVRRTKGELLTYCKDREGAIKICPDSIEVSFMKALAKKIPFKTTNKIEFSNDTLRSAPDLKWFWDK